MQCNIRMQQLVPLILYGVCTAPMAQERAFLERIERIEQGLTPAQVLAGSPVVGRALTDEMRRLRVPGVSIAVIDRGQIAWAKGYGVTHAGGPAVTPQTRFQAAALSKPVAASKIHSLLAEQARLLAEAGGVAATTLEQGHAA